MTQIDIMILFVGNSDQQLIRGARLQMFTVVIWSLDYDTPYLVLEPESALVMK